MRRDGRDGHCEGDEHARPARPARPIRRGTTLVELLVVLVLLGLIASLSTIGVVSMRPDESEETIMFDRARREAAITGQPQVITVDSTTVRLLPDGREIHARAVHLSGDGDR
jgi:prepilin-type N-terminal cleavage/methylation domain-containing protein